MTTLHTFASGSSGNALLVSGNGSHILVDAGISCRRISTGLQSLGLSLQQLDAIFITHTHSDHISGMQTLLKKTTCSVYGSARTCRELEYRLAGISGRLQPLPSCCSVSLGSGSVTLIPTSHDAPGACGYRFDTPDGALAVLTDTGFITEEAADLLPGVDLAVLEANHDVEMLRSGSYPYFLKQRILSSEGHLSNEAAAQFAVTLADSGIGEIVLAHLSRENNTPDKAQHAVETALCAAGCTHVRLSVAPRDSVSCTYTVSGRNICKKSALSALEN